MPKAPKRILRPRRKKGEGSIHFRPRLGLYAGTVELESDVPGKRRRRHLYGRTEGEVLARLKAVQREIDDGDSGKIPERITVAAYMTRWLSDSAPQRPTTQRSYAGVINGHILGPDGIGAKRLRELRAADVETFYARLRGNGIGARTIQLTHAVLRRSLGHALKLGLVTRNAATLVDAPSYRPATIKPLTNAQLKKLLAAASDDRLGPLYTLAVFSGAREGEILGMQWGDLNLKQGTIQIVRSLQDIGGKTVVAETKTRGSRRLIHIPKAAVDALEAHRKRSIAEGLTVAAGDFVFRAPNGGPIQRRNLVARSFKPLLKRAGLPDARFHDLRHSFASAMLEIGTNAKIVQEALGHASIKTTLDVYAHVVPALSKEAARRLGQALAPRSKNS